ncbi:DUF4084 domain-containing protein [Bacillus alkalicellulosilyticus]|uniref:DUF4084 domain-containing protein n=1 Tax=Alkalihalobacterium alkalicellulosilyticum TaxID=1912214 RepID=UPI0009988BB1|nr:DUF4084 domain-containing protein [Bacillus alkalicellulosilyticus]
MKIIRDTKEVIIFISIIIFVLLYYLWIFSWNEHEYLLTLGGNSFAIIGSLIPAFWLAVACKKSGKNQNPFWFFLSLGVFSFFLGELSWSYYENVLRTDVPYPGLPDLFYMLTNVFFLIGFLYKLFKERKKNHVVKMLFDIVIIMTVASTFSWHFIIGPIAFDSEVPLSTLIVSLSYPIGELALLLCAFSIYFGNRVSFFQQRSLFFIFLGLLALALADAIYTYQLITDDYFSGSWVDPIFVAALLFIGFSALVHKGELNRNEQKSVEVKFYRGTEYVRLLVPYLSVIALFIFMIIRPKQTDEFDAITIGTAISIVLIIVRQLFFIVENQKLLRKFYHKAEELELNEQRYKSLFDYHPDAVYSLNLNGEFDSVNHACASILGYQKNELIGLSSTIFIDSGEREMVFGHFKNVKDGIPQRYEVKVYDRNSQLYYLSMTNIPIRVKGKVIGIFAIGKDITKNKLNEKKIKYLAYHDSLTGLGNRYYFEEVLRKEIRDSKQNDKKFAIMFIDLDRFKPINDLLGHDIGDQLLISVANRLKNCIGESNTVARLGGDEFTILVRDVVSQSEVNAVASQIITCIQKPHLINGSEIVTTPSIGIAYYPLDDVTTVALMKKADIAMYYVKENGRSHYISFSETNQNYSKRLQLEKDLSSAIENQEFTIYYQPQVNAKTLKVIGVEALIRWQHPEYGLVSPLEFIPIAEETGKIFSIGEWVIREACMQIKKWHELGYPLKVGINLSPRQFHDDQLVSKINQIIKETGVEAKFIDIEITEMIAITNMKKVIPIINALKNLGVSVSIDDFGTGHSSLSYLTQLPIDTLKIAREFTMKITDSEANYTIVESIATLAKKLNLRVIVEGVETNEQADLLRKISCDEFQGYLTGKPNAAPIIEEMLAISKKPSGNTKKIRS